MMSDAMRDKCRECGMIVLPGEYHPYAGCVMYRQTRQADKVRSLLQSVQADALEHAGRGEPVAEYSQGVASDGAAILKDGQPMTIEEILSELRGRAAPEGCTDTLVELRKANRERLSLWDPNGKITPLFSATELAGEVGEALNVVKKIERGRMGLAGSTDTAEHLAEELADVIICADLVAYHYGIDLTLAVPQKFNATSRKVGFSVYMGAVCIYSDCACPIDKTTICARGLPEK